MNILCPQGFLYSECKINNCIGLLLLRVVTKPAVVLGELANQVHRLAHTPEEVT